MTAHEGKTAEQWAEMFYKLDAQCQEYLQQVHARQLRDQKERETTFRVVTIAKIAAYGEATTQDIATQIHRDEISTYEEAEIIAKFYDDAIIQTRNATPWKEVTAKTETLTGN